MGRQFKPGQLQTGSLYNISSSYALSASYAPFVATNTGSLLVTASILNANITFTKGDSTQFGITVNNVASASYAATASYLTGYISPFPYTGSAQITGSLGITGSLSVIGSITGSLLGTASYATNALSASYITLAQTASYVNPLNQNVQLTGSLYLSTPEVASVYFSGSSAASRLVWNNTDGTLNLGLKGGNVTLQIGQEQVVRVVNKTGANLLESQYKAIRIRRVDEGGAQGQRLAVVLAQANDDANSVDTLGLVTENIDVNQEGFITNSGLVRGIDTTGTLQGETWADGDVLYLSPTTAGSITKVKPQAPQHSVTIGYVVYAHANNGTIFVKVDNGYEIDELHNVRINTGSLTSGDLLVYSSSVWINTKQLTGSYNLSGSLTATSFTGSLQGTASYATQALSASYAPTIIPSGQFGIANTSGVYTYYATFTLAMAAATSGQTIEMFANVTETGAVTITLKNGVNINGNGHTYTLNNSGLIHALSAANSVVTSCNILNINVIRTGSTGSLADNSCLILGINASGVINCSGSTFTNSGSGCGILFLANAAFEINYAVAYATTGYGAFGIFSGLAKLNNCIGYGTSGGIGIRCHSGGDIQNCTGVSDSGYGIYGLGGNQSNSVGISTSGIGFAGNNNAFNCVGRSISSIGFEATNAINVVGCVGISVSGIGLSVTNGLIYNCTGISSSSRGMSIVNSSKGYNINSKSTSSYSIFANAANVEIHNATIISEWNNAGGIGISSNSTFIPAIILNSTFLLANATAPYLFNNTTAQAVSTRGNTYKGGAAYSALITQAIVATEDAQGNIYL